MRQFLIAVFCLLSLDSAYGQYEIMGPRFVENPCVHYKFYLETNLQFESTYWGVISSGELLFPTITETWVLFPAAGTYWVVANSVSINGEIFTDTFQVEVLNNFPQLQVGGCFVSPDSANACYQVCAFSQTTIWADQGSEFEVTGALSWEWLGSGGITITWGAGGPGMVTAYLSGGCKVSTCFDIQSMPVADFDVVGFGHADTITICENALINFNNTTTGSQSFQWDFGDGNSSTEEDASHQYETPGTYTVTLNANGICECIDEKSIVVNVLVSPTPELDCISSVCPGMRQRYTATTHGCNELYWSVSSHGTIVNGGGTTDDFIEVIWHDGPQGVITLSVANCAISTCLIPVDFYVPIISPQATIAGDDVVCGGETITYTAPYFPGTQYSWTVGNYGTIESGQYTNIITVKWQDGNFAAQSVVDVQYDNCFLECGGKGTLPITLTVAYVLAGVHEVCEGSSATIAANSIVGGPANVTWHIEDANGVIVFSQGTPNFELDHEYNFPPGLYEVVATNASDLYCNSELRHLIRVVAKPDPPLAILGDPYVCPGNLHGFTIDAAGTYSTVWTIHDGPTNRPMFGQTIGTAFGTTPPYSVEAYHADIQFSACKSDPIELQLQPLGQQLITGTSESCLYDTKVFQFPFTSGADYQWEVIPATRGEIRRSDLNTIEVFWTEAGSATIQVTTCGKTIQHAVVIHDLPAFAFMGPTAACVDVPVTISTDQPGLQHAWYDEAGTFISSFNTVSLLPGAYSAAVTDTRGCEATELLTITSYPTPKVKLTSPVSLFYCDSVDNGIQIVANTDGGGYIFNWIQDSINVGIGAATFHVTDFGKYQVMVTNQYGCSALSEELEFLNCCPVESCGSGGGICNLPGCTYFDFPLDIVKDGSDCNQRKYHIATPGVTAGTAVWGIYTAGEKVVAIQQADVFQYPYQLPGYYFIQVICEFDGFTYPDGVCGHQFFFADTIRAVADFKAEGYCINSPVVFEDLTTFLPDETITAWNWNFGDPASGASNLSTAQDPDHTFAVAGNYFVTLTVTLASGCTTTKQRLVKISNGPALSPVYDPVYCEHEAQAFSITGELFDVEWTFDDPLSGIQNAAEGLSVLHTYDKPGMYTVGISATDVFGCKSNTSIPVEIKPNTLTGEITAVPNTTICFGDSVLLTAPAGGISWAWSNGTNTDAIWVNENSTHQVTIQDAFHCTWTPAPVNVLVAPIPEVAIGVREILADGSFGPWDTTLHICYGTEIEMQAFSSIPGVEFTWNIWTHQHDQTIQFTDEGGDLLWHGTHDFYVFATDPANCSSDTVHVKVIVAELPEVPVIALQSGTGCGMNVNVLAVTNVEAGVTYLWSNGQTGSTITTTAHGDFFAIALNASGCEARSNLLNIRPGAAVDQIQGGCYLKCNPLELCLPPLQNVTAYHLYHNGTIIQSGSTWPDSLPINTDGSYHFEVTLANGCKAESDPLDLSLYPGVGSITVLTYYDVDGDGIISAADTLISGLPVEIESNDGLHTGGAVTDADGQLVLTDFPVSGYTALFDQSSFPSNLTIVIDSALTQIVACDDSVSVALLVTRNCFVSGPDVIVEICKGETVTVGDSTWTDFGTHEAHLLSVFGCDSVFNVQIHPHDTLEINTIVWVDVDEDGVVSAADTTITGITIILDRLIGHAPYTEVTDSNGETKGEYLPGPYIVAIDSTILPGGFSIIYGQDFIADTACYTTSFNFLLSTSCNNVYHLRQEFICEGDSIQLEGLWVDDPGVYAFIVGQVGLCDSILEVTLDTLPHLHAVATATWNCETGGNVELVVNGIDPLDIAWSSSLIEGTSGSVLPADTYLYVITDGNGCDKTGSIDVIETPWLQFDVDSLFEINAGESVTIPIKGDTASHGLHIHWTGGSILDCDTCTSVIATPLQDTVLFITLHDESGCEYVLETRIVIREDSSFSDELYVPNVFTPNGDGINDYWHMTSRLPDAFVNKLAIFDRWGNLVFEKKAFMLNEFDGWDGTFRGKKMNPAVYAFSGTVRLSDGEVRVIKGDITLVR